ncbi:MAG: FtsQ-type POTRA domain-containing protein [bacterium]
MSRNRRNRKRQTWRERLEVAARAGRFVVSRAVPIAGLALVGFGIPAAAYVGYTYAVSSDYFALKNVELIGLHRTERDPFMLAVGLKPGMNIFDVDPEAVAANAEAQPWIRHAEIERTLPDYISIKVEEHQPAAMLIDGGYVLVNGDAEPFKELDASDDVNAMFMLPLVSGLQRRELETADGKSRFLDALAAHRAYEHAGLAKLYPLSEIHVDRVMGVSLVTRQMGTEIRLGQGRWEERMARLKSVLDAMLVDGQDVDYILVDDDDNYRVIC